MSAFVVDKVHIDALVTAGLAYGGLRWFDRPPTEEELVETHQPGVALPPGSVDWYQRHVRYLEVL